MRLAQPSLTVTFYKATPETVTVTDSDLIRDSFIFSEQLLNGLTPSSNKVSFKLHKKASVIEKILSYQVDAKAVLSDGNTTLFTGYLSDNYTWKVNTSGESELEIILEDIGTKLLGKAFLTSDAPSVYYLNGKVYSGSNSILTQICTRAGISIAANQDAITTEIAANIDKNLTCKDLLGNVLLESGYTYYFNNLGALCLYKIDCTSVNNIPVIDKGQLYEVSKNAITLTKKTKQYKQVNVSYDEYETRSGVLAYKDISGQDSSHPDCNITIKPGAYYPVKLLEVSSIADMKALGTSDVELGSYVKVVANTKVYQVVELGTPGADYDGTSYSFIESSISEVSFVEAEDLDRGKEVISISNVAGSVNYTGSLSYTISQRGSKNISVVLHNTGSTDVNVTRLQATATIVDVKAKCIVVAGEGSSVDTSDNVYSTSTKYIHTKDSASQYANLIVNYYKYCNYTYQFNATVDYALGSIVNVVDNLFSGLTVNLMLTAKSYTDKSNIIKYTGVAISPFNLSADTGHEQTLAPESSGTQGPEGKGISSIVDWYATSATQTGAKTAYERTLPTLNATTKKYLWIKQVTTYTDGTTSFTESIGAIYGDTGNPGENADVLDIILDSPTYLENRRLSGTNAVNATVSLQGKYSSGTIVVKDLSDNPLTYITEKNGSSITATSTISVVDGDFFKLSIPFVNDFDVKVVLTSSTDSVDKVISPIDGTTYGHCYGLLASAPDSSSDPKPIFEAGKETDYYTNSVSGITYEYTGSNWVACTDAARLTTGLKLLLDGGVNIATISDANSVSFFKDIIAQQIYVNTIKAVQGFFDSIHVTGLSLFDGQIVNDAMTTYPSESSTREIRLTNASGGNVNPMFWTDGHGNVLSGPLDPNNPNNPSLSPRGAIGNLYTPLLSVADLNAAFPQYGTYIATAGTLTFTGLSGTEYYTASPAMPITLIYQQNYFSIQRNGETLVTYGVYNTVTDETYHHLFYPPFPNMLIISDRALARSGGSTSYGRFATYYGTDSLQIGGYQGYAEMTNIVPKTNTNYIGTTAKPYDVIRANEIYGTTLGGTLNGNVVGNVTGDVTGNLLGNVNSAATGGTYNVFGAVFN